MIEWWGPIIFEYYGATEGGGSHGDHVSDEWLAHPGSVGRPFLSDVHILDEEGNECPTGETGVVWFEPDERALKFDYYKDPEKTTAAHNREAGAPSATWATSTTRATSTSPTGATS